MPEYELGKWDLSELAKDPKGPVFQKQIKDLEEMAKRFEKIKLKLDPKISSKKFMDILHEVEDISEKMSRIGGYASLLYSADTQSDEATSLMTRMSKLNRRFLTKFYFLICGGKPKLTTRMQKGWSEIQENWQNI